MKNTNSFLLPALAVLASLVLSACGGGGGTDTGGGSGGGGTTTYTATCYDTTTRTSTVSLADAQALCPVQTSVAIVTSVPAATYAANSQEKAAFDYLNNARSTCGFGKLAQNAQLDAAAANHANYQMLNNTSGHYETQGLTGYTGYDPQARAAAAGYIGIASEDNVISPGNVLPTTSIDETRSLISAPYHFADLFNSWRDVGVKLGVRSGAYTMNFNPGVRTGDFKQQPAVGTVLTYPCHGTIDTARSMGNETPWPIPGRTDAIGQPIIIQVAEGSTLVLDTYSITRTAGPGIDAGTVANGSVLGATSTLLKLDHSNDTNNRFTNRYNVAMLMPDKTMFPGATYRVQITGTVNGTAFSKDFTFTTTGRTYYDACLVDPQEINRYGAVTPHFCAGGSASVTQVRTLNGQPTNYPCGTPNVVCTMQAVNRTDLF